MFGALVAALRDSLPDLQLIRTHILLYPHAKELKKRLQFGSEFLKQAPTLQSAFVYQRIPEGPGLSQVYAASLFGIHSGFWSTLRVLPKVVMPGVLFVAPECRRPYCSFGFVCVAPVWRLKACCCEDP